MFRKRKGKFGYIAKMRKNALIRTAVLFLIAVIIFAVGYFIYLKKENFLTIFAVLMVLPAARSLVNSIMFLRFRSCDERIKDKVDELIEEAGKEQTAPAHCFYEPFLYILEPDSGSDSSEQASCEDHEGSSGADAGKQ